MQVRDIFGLVIRLTGAAFVIFSVFSLFHVVTTLTGLPMPSRYSWQVDLLSAVVWFALGTVLVLCAEWITRIAYGRDLRSPKSPS